MNEIRNYENSLLDLKSHVPDGRFIETWECPAVLEKEVINAGFADRTLQGHVCDFGGLKPSPQCHFPVIRLLFITSKGQTISESLLHIKAQFSSVVV